jgi:hypothetical protein
VIVCRFFRLLEPDTPGRVDDVRQVCTGYAAHDDLDTALAILQVSADAY